MTTGTTGATGRPLITTRKRHMFFLIHFVLFGKKAKGILFSMLSLSTNQDNAQPQNSKTSKSCPYPRALGACAGAYQACLLLVLNHPKHLLQDMVKRHAHQIPFRGIIRSNSFPAVIKNKTRLLAAGLASLLVFRGSPLLQPVSCF